MPSLSALASWLRLVDCAGMMRSTSRRQNGSAIQTSS